MLRNRAQLVESVFDGFAEESNDLFAFRFRSYAGPNVFPIRPHDPERAKPLLKAAGHEDLQLTLYANDVATGIVEGATVYAQQAASGGVKIKVGSVNPALY